MLSHPLADRWRARAQERHAEGLDAVAKIYERCADELDAYERTRALEALTLREAAAESGYTQSHLSRLLAEGKLVNAGQPYAPRIIRRDLPRKPNAAPKAGNGEPDLVGEALRGPTKEGG
jgi:hypothetical protein